MATITGTSWVSWLP